MANADQGKAIRLSNVEMTRPDARHQLEDRRYAQLLFWRLLDDVVPAARQELEAKVFPRYLNKFKQAFPTQSLPNSLEEAVIRLAEARKNPWVKSYRETDEELRSELDRWVETYRLDAEWIRSDAMATLFRWVRQSPAERSWPSDALITESGKPSSMASDAELALSAYSISEGLIKSILSNRAQLHLRFPDDPGVRSLVFRADGFALEHPDIDRLDVGAVPMSFQAEGYCPVLETRREAKAKILNQFVRELESYLDRVEDIYRVLGYQEQVDRDNLRAHLTWLIMFQVKGLSYRDVAVHLKGAVKTKTLQNQVPQTAKLIDLPLRTGGKRGRSTSLNLS